MLPPMMWQIWHIITPSGNISDFIVYGKPFIVFGLTLIAQFRNLKQGSICCPFEASATWSRVFEQTKLYSLREGMISLK